MVFAKTSKAASRLSEQMRTHQIEKKYYAVVEGTLKEKDTYIDKLYKDTKLNKVTVDNRGKEAILSYERVKTYKRYSLTDITLKTDRKSVV